MIYNDRDMSVLYPDGNIPSGLVDILNAYERNQRMRGAFVRILDWEQLCLLVAVVDPQRGLPSGDLPVAGTPEFPELSPDPSPAVGKPPRPAPPRPSKL